MSKSVCGIALASAALVFGACGGGSSSAMPSGAAPVNRAMQLAFNDQFTRLIDEAPILGPDGTPYTFPFLGGVDVPRPQFIDIDADGDADLFLQERTDELMFFENIGTAQAPIFEWRTDRYADLHIGEWSRFYDLDDDGDLDILAETLYSYVRYFRNDGTVGNPNFVLVQDSIPGSDGTPLFSDRQNIPFIVDIDCDAQPDLFLGRVDGTVQRWERVRITDEGVPIFTMRTERFEDIEIVAAISTPGGVQPRANTPGGRAGGRSGGPPFGGTRPTLHGANSMSFADVDGDGDQDFFWGDFFEAGLLWIENRGTCANPDFRYEPRALPAPDTVMTSGYNASAHVDLDGDNDLDLVMGVLGGAFNPNQTGADNLFHFERGEDGIYRTITTRFLDGFDIGSESVPALGDLDGDGDLDLLVGNKLDPSEVRIAKLYHLENIGTNRAPEFAMRDTLTFGEYFHLAPNLTDIDGDSDLDIILGTWNDDVLLVRNTGTAASPRFEIEGEAPMVELTRGSHSVPELGDLDGDGDLDLLVGESSGEINYYTNVGSPTAPVFELVSDKFDDMDIGRRSAPRLVDMDGDGDLDLIIGREDGSAGLFRNEGTVTSPRFVPAGDFSADLPRFSTPVLGDLDGDGDLDVISGGMGGGLTWFRNAGGGGS